MPSCRGALEALLRALFFSFVIIIFFFFGGGVVWGGGESNGEALHRYQLR